MLLIELVIPVSCGARSFSNPYHRPVLAPILQMRSRGQERIRNLPEVAQVGSGAGTSTQAWLMPELSKEGFCSHLGSKVCTQGHLQVSSGAPEMWLPAWGRRASWLYDSWVRFHNSYLKKPNEASTMADSPQPDHRA